MTVLASLLLAAVFFSAALAKLRRPVDFRVVLDSVGLPFAALLTVAVPIAELAVGVWLLSGVAPRIAAVAALCLLLAFSASLVSLPHGKEAPQGCGCFGESRDGSSPRTGLIRNALLSVAAVVMLVAPPQSSALGGDLVDLVGHLTLVAGTFCLWGCLVALWDPPGLESAEGAV